MNRPVVVKTIERIGREAVEQLEHFGVSTIHEAQGRCGLLANYMRPIYSGPPVAGYAITVSLPAADNLMLHVAVEVCQPGDMLVVAPTSYCSDGYFGELLATSLRARGVKALVIESGVRDIHLLTEMKFPVWSRAVCSQGTAKATLGSVNVPIVCADALVTPGDIVVADDDGVVVVKRELVDEVIKMSARRSERESSVRQRLAQGESGLDIYGWRDRLGDLEYRD